MNGPGAIADWLVAKSSRVLDARLSRRGFITKTTIAGSGLVATACVGAGNFVYQSNCKGGLCKDGYTEFCCMINSGYNACPAGSIPSGWWRADNSVFCGGGTRYIVDCNDFGGGGPCRCAVDCNTRKVYCNVFRYGQCNQQVGGNGVIACRVVTCTPPYAIPEFNCTASDAVDNSTANHSADCPPIPAPPPPPPVPVPVLPISAAAVVRADGSRWAFTRTPAGTVQYATNPGAGWSAWTDLGGDPINSAIDAAATTAGITLVARRTSDGTGVTRFFDGTTWSPALPGWQALGGGLAGDPFIVNVGTDVVVVAHTVDAAFWWNRRSGSTWSGWQPMGGGFDSNPALAVIGSSVYVVGRGGDQGYWVNVINGSSVSGWGGIGGRLTSEPTVVSRGTDLFVFGRGGDNAMYIQSLTASGWSGWLSLGGALAGDPVATVDAAGRVWLFARGVDGALWYWRLTGNTWGSWTSLGRTVTADPEVVVNGNIVSVFARLDDNALWQRQYNGSAFDASWTSLGGAPIDAVSAH